LRERVGLRRLKMKAKNIHEASDWFEVLQTTKRTQTAMMTLKPGKSSGSEPEGHKDSDQVLLVLKGEVEGEIEDETVALREGDVIVIPAVTRHKFTNRSSADAVTFNTYSPPEY
jgi:mannose-6-phosphate isomerase-like protein (cupin superfamily)